MSDAITLRDAELYLEEFYRHLDAGDDALNAKCRIIEQGCPPDVADKIEAAAFKDDDDEEDA